MNNDITRIYDTYRPDIGTMQQREGTQHVEIYDVQVNFHDDVHLTCQKRSNPMLHKYYECIDAPLGGIQNVTLGNIGNVNVHQKKEYLD